MQGKVKNLNDLETCWEAGNMAVQVSKIEN